MEAEGVFIRGRRLRVQQREQHRSVSTGIHTSCWLDITATVLVCAMKVDATLLICWWTSQRWRTGPQHHSACLSSAGSLRHDSMSEIRQSRADICCDRVCELQPLNPNCEDDVGDTAVLSARRNGLLQSSSWRPAVQPYQSVLLARLCPDTLFFMLLSEQYHSLQSHEGSGFASTHRSIYGCNRAGCKCRPGPG